MDLFNRLNAALGRFLPYDKALHLIGGAALFLAALVLGAPPLVALAVVVVAAVVKELYDLAHRQAHTPDPWDAIYTAAAAVVGYLVMVLLR